MADSKNEDAVPLVTQASWERVHERLVSFARTRAGLDFEEGAWLLAAARERVDRRLGYASVVEYIQRLFGYAPRLTQEKLRVAEALEQLPALAAALQNAETCWSSVRELTRVATPATEKAWMDAARGRSARDVERLVSGRARGSLPTDPADDRLRRHVLRFEVSGDVLATFRDAITKIRQDAGVPLDDDATLLLMARHVLGGPVDEGRASYQVELSVCEDCRRARQQGGGELVEVAASIADMADCDAQRLHSAHVDGANIPALDLSGARAGGASNPALDLSCAQAGGASTPAQNSRLTHADRAKVHPRARQQIPPALRREILRRDRRRCQVPGCLHYTFLDLHHIQPREEGGQHEADNLVTLCGAHHRAAHNGELWVEGRVATGLTFKHADGHDYGAVMQHAAATIDAQTKAFQALRQLGFGEREARRALAESLDQCGADASAESRLRAALELLTENAFQRAS